MQKDSSGIRGFFIVFLRKDCVNNGEFWAGEGKTGSFYQKVLFKFNT